MTFADQLRRMNACEEAVAWVGDRALEQAWQECDRGDWMTWLTYRLGIDARRAAADIAESVWHLVEPESRLACAWAIDCARRGADDDERAAAEAAAADAAEAAGAAAWAAAWAAAGAAAKAAGDAAGAAEAAAWAAEAAAKAAGDAAGAAEAAGDAAGDAAWAAADAAWAAGAAARSAKKREIADIMRQHCTWHQSAQAMQELN